MLLLRIIAVYVLAAWLTLAFEIWIAPLFLSKDWSVEGGFGTFFLFLPISLFILAPLGLLGVIEFRNNFRRLGDKKWWKSEGWFLTIHVMNLMVITSTLFIATRFVGPIKNSDSQKLTWALFTDDDVNTHLLHNLKQSEFN